MRKRRESISLPEPVFLPRRKDFSDRCGIKYNQEYDRIIYFFTLLGATDFQIAEALEMSPASLTLWKNKYPNLKAAVDSGKLEADSKVAHALYQSAVGYEHTEEVVLTNKVTEYSEEGKLLRSYNEALIVKVKKKYPPNVTAIIKWLQVRQPALWRDNSNFQGKLTVEHTVDLKDFSTTELEALNKLSIIRHKNNVEDIGYVNE